MPQEERFFKMISNLLLRQRRSLLLPTLLRHSRTQLTLGKTKMFTVKLRCHGRNFLTSQIKQISSNQNNALFFFGESQWESPKSALNSTAEICIFEQVRFDSKDFVPHLNANSIKIGANKKKSEEALLQTASMIMTFEVGWIHEFAS